MAKFGPITARARRFRDAIAAPGSRESSGEDRMECPYCVGAYGGSGRVQQERSHLEKRFADGYQGECVVSDPPHWLLDGKRWEQRPIVRTTSKGRYSPPRLHPRAVYMPTAYEAGHGPNDPFTLVKVIDVPACSYCDGAGYVDVTYSFKVQ